MITKYDMIKVAHLYYNLGCNQQEIAEKMRTSRARVSRLLKSAIDEGVVQIHVDGYKDSCVELETLLEEKFGLQSARVVEQARSDTGTADILQFLDGFVEDGMTLGVTFGSTLARLAASSGLRPREHVRVVQLTGGLNYSELVYTPDEIAGRFARMFGGSAYNLYIPAIVSNHLLKDLIRQEEFHQKIFELYGQVDAAFFAVGTMLPIDILLRDGYINQELFDSFIEKRAIGNVCLRYFNQEGKLVDPELENRITGISLEEILRIPIRIGIAYGKYKADAIRAAIRAGFLNVLVTDVQTAHRLLEESDPV